MSNENVFYLEKKIRQSERENRLILFDAAKYYDNPDTEVEELFSEQTVNKAIVDDFSGFFVFDEEGFHPGNRHTIAKHFILKNTRIRDVLIKRSEKKEITQESLTSGNSDEVDSTTLYDSGDTKTSQTGVIKAPFESKDELFSFHVNVGHGNCSIIFADGKIYMVDCSEYDYLQKKHYRDNILECIDFIKNKFHLQDFIVDSFILTHTHYDHFSGMPMLMEQGFLTERADIYLNDYYSCQSPVYTDMLEKMKDRNFRITNPIKQRVSPFMEFLYPDVCIIKKKGNMVPDNCDFKVVGNPNNASIVTLFSKDGNSFLFPGDLETEGWNDFKSCDLCKKNISYYAISHHGSENGFIRNCKTNPKIKNLADCITPSLAVLMGRDNAYNNMPSANVINSFNVLYTEKDKNKNTAKFLELDWKTGKPTYH